MNNDSGLGGGVGLGASATGLWTVCPGDARWVSVPGVAKPINAGSAERAQLIAAAPELLKTLELIADGLSADGRTMDGMTKAAAVIKARAAIAKAEGGAS